MSISRGRTFGSGVAVVAVASLLAACSGDVADKTGGDSLVLRLASIDEVNSNGQAYGPQTFVEQLSAVSGGRIKVDVAQQYGEGDADAESKLVEAIATGEIDGGWPATRAFANAGVPGLEPVEAPLTISSYAAEKELVSGPVATRLLGRLDGSGVVGLGLAVGPLRRPFAVASTLLEPEDWRGAPFRVYNSPVQTDTVKALGADPRNVGFGWIDEVRNGNLRGVEFDLGQYQKNGYGAEAGNVTGNIVLWPKVYVLSLSRKRFDELTLRQRQWIGEAAARAVQASVEAKYDDSAIARELCTRKVRIHDASPAQIAAMRELVRPVLDGLATNPADAVVLNEIQAIAARNPDPEPLDVPAECRHGIATFGGLGPIPDTVSALPDGVYRVELTPADLTGRSTDTGLAGTWTLKVSHGTYELSCRPIATVGIDCGHEDYDGPLDVGDLRGTGHLAYFNYRPDRLAQLTGCRLPVSQTRPGACFAGQPYAMTWEIQGDQLTFSEYVSDWANVQFLIEPWRKIA
jgi:TRAP-type C4-dicarboxylate transport system substrate-binding protein